MHFLSMFGELGLSLKTTNILESITAQVEDHPQPGLFVWMRILKGGRRLVFRAHSENADITGAPMTSMHTRREHEIRYEAAAELSSGKEVLDLGCGYGYGAAIMARAARSVVGVDRDSRAIEVAKSRYRLLANTQFVDSDVFEYLRRVSQQFDMVVALEVIEHVEQQDELLDLVWRITRNGGRIFLSTPNAARTPFYRRNPYHFRELSADELRKIVGIYYEIDLFKGQTEGWLWTYLPHLLISPFTSILGVYKRMVELNDRPRRSKTSVVSGIRRAVPIKV